MEINLLSIWMFYAEKADIIFFLYKVLHTLVCMYALKIDGLLGAFHILFLLAV